MEASVNSSGYTAQIKKKVADLLAESERHFRSDNCDMAYEEDLVAQVEEAEDLCLQKDGPFLCQCTINSAGSQQFQSCHKSGL